MPGFDKSRIVGLAAQDLDEFTCAICLAIFINPMVTQCCRQTYCKDCIREWLSGNESCPNDRSRITMEDLRPVPRVMINLLDNMKVKCEYEVEGCSIGVRREQLNQHISVCHYRPNKLCNTCGLFRELVSTHNCIQSLIIEKDKTEANYLNLFEEKSQLLSEINEQDKIMSALRYDLAELQNNQQLIFNELSEEYTRVVNQLKNNYNTTIEKERKSHKNELVYIRKTYVNKVSNTVDQIKRNHKNELANLRDCHRIRINALVLCFVLISGIYIKNKFIH